MLSLFSNNSSTSKKKKKMNNGDNNLSNINNNYINKLNNYTFYNKFLNSNNSKNKFKEPIGLYDPLGKNINPLTGKEYQNYYSTVLDRYEGGKLAGKSFYKTYKNLSYIWTNLPMYKHITSILNSIRDNHITRDEGLVLVNNYEGEFPKKYFEEFLEYLNISEKRFWEVVNSWRPNHLWKRSGKDWKLKFPPI